ncbi:hypothetical protein PUN28_019231 [Cardiocondyla obscurior]|uniref:Uncharacterized protein n=1 Tax=Cardiocondyla obscurior TaxID=286306 RepID=A0AAW2ECK8_9HYME
MFTWKYEDLKYGRLETRYAGYGITRKKSGVERSRIFKKAVYVTPLQTYFRLPCWSLSDKPLRKQTFRQYRSRFIPGSSESPRPLLSIPRSSSYPTISTVLLITSGLFNSISSKRQFPAAAFPPPS